jgi:hypothetical protein
MCIRIRICLPFYRVQYGVIDGVEEALEIAFEYIIYIGWVKKLQHPMLCGPFGSVAGIVTIPL